MQAGTGTDEIGRFDIMVDTDLNAIDTFTWRMVPIDDMHCPRDEELERFIQHYKSVTSEKYDRIITRLSCELTHPKRNQETSLGDLIADILRDSFGIDLMLMGSGAIRSYALGPWSTTPTLWSACPMTTRCICSRSPAPSSSG